MKRFLITTADESTWRVDCPVLFLGEWCRRYDRRSSWEGLDADVVPYHWDDRNQYYRDHLYICSVYEDVLRRTGDALNAHHGTAYSLRYWRILIGPWASLFTQVLFDRWAMVQRAAAYQLEGTFIRPYHPADVIPRDTNGMNPDSLTWNHYLFGRAITHQNRMPWTELPARGRPDGDLSPGKAVDGRAVTTHLRNACRRAAASWQRVFTRNTDAMLINTYLPPLQQMKLELALGQIPKRWPVPEAENVPPDLAQRSVFSIVSDRADPFHQFLCTMVAEQIPSIYLEGYQGLQRTVASLPWPQNPSVIFTSNLFQYCEPFKAWAAAKTEAKAPFVIGQHGGLLGTGKWHAGEDHQVAIANRYISWGWSDDRPSIYPCAALTNVGKAVGTWTPHGSLLMVPTVIRNVAFESSAWPTASQNELYFQEQTRFVEALSPHVRAALVLRIRKTYDDRVRAGFFDRLRDAFPDVQLDDSTGPIERRIRACRLFVYSFNSTGFLETLARDIPTVIFWNPRYFELRPAAEPYFELLRESYIFHHTPDAAAAHVHTVWNDVAKWWHSDAVQHARQEFCQVYARMPERPIDALKHALQTAASFVPAGSSALEPPAVLPTSGTRPG